MEQGQEAEPKDRETEEAEGKEERPEKALDVKKAGKRETVKT